MAIEIERKWLLKQLPESSPVLRETHSDIVFLSTKPYVRISDVTTNDPARHRTIFCVKGDGDLSREENEWYVDHSMFTALVAAGYEPMHKHNFWYSSCDDSAHKMSVSIVDEGTAHEFIYAEVEFDDEEKAKAYQFPYDECGAVDVTGLKMFKMNHVWSVLHGDVRDDGARSFLSSTIEFYRTLG